MPYSPVPLIMAAGLLVLRAEADRTITGATVVLQDGQMRFLSFAGAEPPVGFGPAAGNA